MTKLLLLCHQRCTQHLLWAQLSMCCIIHFVSRQENTFSTQCPVHWVLDSRLASWRTRPQLGSSNWIQSSLGATRMKLLRHIRNENLCGIPKNWFVLCTPTARWDGQLRDITVTRMRKQEARILTLECMRCAQHVMSP